MTQNRDQVVFGPGIRWSTLSYRHEPGGEIVEDMVRMLVGVEDFLLLLAVADGGTSMDLKAKL